MRRPREPSAVVCVSTTASSAPPDLFFGIHLARQRTVVVGVASRQGIELARQACAAGKDVFLLRPLEFEDELQLLACDAKLARRAVHLFRRSAIPLDRAYSLALIAERAADVHCVEVYAEVEALPRSTAPASIHCWTISTSPGRSSERPAANFDLVGEAIAPGTRPVRQRRGLSRRGGISGQKS